MNKKWNLESVRKLFLDRGCILLEQSYVNTKTSMRYIATCGHEHSISLDNFKSHKGDLCERCRRLSNAQKESLGSEKILAAFRAAGCTPLTENVATNDVKVKYIAQCGHENEITYGHFMQGSGRICASCSRSIRYKYDYVREMFENADCELLEKEYVNCKKPMRYIAKCGHESVISFDVFLNAPSATKRCRLCHKKTYHEVVSDRNRTASKTWRLEVYQRDNFRCQVCGVHSYELNAHHLDAYDTNPDKRFSIENGVTLCTKCHISFHREYGFGGNTKEQFDTWVREYRGKHTDNTV